MTRAIRFLLLALALALAGCAPRAAAPTPAASVEPLNVSVRGSSPLDDLAASGPADTKDVTDPADEAAIKLVIERANNLQAEAFAKNDPTLMRDTAMEEYYQELVRINQGMAEEGVSAIKLLKLEWGDISVSGSTAQATTFETWRTDYKDGTGDQERDRNVYTLVREGGGWKIQSDAHPDSRLDQPAGQATTGPTGPAPSPSPFQRPASTGKSHNWSGYSATGGKFTGVSATWTVPQPGPSSFAADAAWVGIGGVRSRDLIQAGTEQTVLPNGRVSYQAWIEKLPQVSRPVQLRISPGDSVTVSITEQQDNVWLISMKNNTTGQTFQTTEDYTSSHSSAEWVQEAPSGRRGIINLSNFGTLKFTDASATKDGKKVTIAGAGGRPITMIDRNDQPIAEPSALGEDGASFSVTRVNPNSQPSSSIPPARRPGVPAERPAA